MNLGGIGLPQVESILNEIERVYSTESESKIAEWTICVFEKSATRVI